MPLVPVVPLVAGLIGGLGKFVWDKVEKRLAAMEESQAKCQARELVSAEQRSKLSQIVELLMMAIRRQDADAPELHRSKQLLLEYNKLTEDAHP